MRTVLILRLSGFLDDLRFRHKNLYDHYHLDGYGYLHVYHDLRSLHFDGHDVDLYYGRLSLSLHVPDVPYGLLFSDVILTWKVLEVNISGFLIRTC